MIPDAPVQAHGDFDVVVKFEPVGGFFSGNVQVAELKGFMTSLTTFAAGAYFNGTHQGADSLSFMSSSPIVNPEPTTFVLVASGMAGFALLRCKQWRD